MGFFSKLFNADPVQFKIEDERDAYLAILLACGSSDGDISEEETAILYTVGNRPFFAGRPLAESVKRAVNYFHKAGGSSALIDMAASAITETTRLSLFLNCVDVILSDGQVTDEEEEILDYLKTMFTIDDDFAAKAVEILLLKNKV